ncbi:MAG: type VI secretion system Vgr family protein [Maricaulaceae bacterium]
MRLLSLEAAPFALDQSSLVTFEGEEMISDVFRFQLGVFAERDAIKPSACLGESLTLSVHDPDLDAPKYRRINGVVAGVRALGDRRANRYAYAFDLRPSFWLTTLTSDCRIFQDKTTGEILEEVLSPYKSSIAYDLRLYKTTRKRSYCVQYNETDFDFLSRVLAEDGIFYYFEYKEGSGVKFDHRVVFSDAAVGYASCAQDRPAFRADASGEAALTAWRSGDALKTLEWRLSDYHRDSPTQKLDATATNSKTDHAARGAYRYHPHGRYVAMGEGDALARLRMEEEETDAETFAGAGGYTHFAAGARITPAADVDAVDSVEAVLVRVRHTAFDYSGFDAAEVKDVLNAGSNAVSYENTFSAMPAASAFRPPYRPRVKAMAGPQTAVVVGPKGEDIYVDPLGRIKVQFHWDRYGQSDEASSCWLPVAQSWAGPGYGAQFIPRIGMEVLVSFIEGDPDRPFVTGCLYNGVNKPPFTLKSEQTKTGWRSISSPPDGDKKINELHFEDKAGAEEIYFKAGKDFTRDVYNNDTLTIDKGNRKIEIKTGDQTHIVRKGDVAMTVETGDQTVDISAGSQSTEAMKKITFKVGPSTITLEPSGITVKAPTIKFEGTAKIEAGAPMISIAADAKLDAKAPMIGLAADVKLDAKATLASVKANAMASLEAPMTKVSGQGMLMLKGGIVMIN